LIRTLHKLCLGQSTNAKVARGQTTPAAGWAIKTQILVWNDKKGKPRPQCHAEPWTHEDQACFIIWFAFFVNPFRDEEGGSK
jgi:hypothetical protein